MSTTNGANDMTTSKTQIATDLDLVKHICDADPFAANLSGLREFWFSSRQFFRLAELGRTENLGRYFSNIQNGYLDLARGDATGTLSRIREAARAEWRQINGR